MIFHAPSRTIVYDGDLLLPETVAVEVRGGRQLVKATYPALVALAAANLPVPSPMLAYDWPSPPGEEAMETQRLVAAHMVLHPRSYVFSDMRTGKSRAALWACDWIMSRAKRRTRTVIVTDLFALNETWIPEITRSLLGRRSYAIMHGTPAQRIRALRQDVDFYLINHDGLKCGYKRKLPSCAGLAAELLKRDDLQMVVFDEAATYRNRETLNWRAAHDLLSMRAAYAWELTGTPTANGPLDAYGLKKLIDPAFRMPFYEWQDKVTERDGMFRRCPKEGWEGAVDELLSPAVRIARTQCFEESPEDVPPPILVELSETQRRHMKALQTQLLTLLENGAEIPAVNEAALRAKFIQISCGAAYDKDHNSHEVDAGPRLDALKRLVMDTEGKIIIFSPLTNVNRMIHKELRPYGSLFVDSTASKHERHETVRRFIGGGERILTSHPGPIARGLDLTAAATIIWYAPVDRTEYYLQANQRINGPRQKATRRILRLTGSTVETEIYKKLEHNQTMQGVILKMKEMRL